MTNPAILEAMVKAIDNAISDGKGRVVEDVAAAVLELVGPKPLVWEDMGSTLRTSFPSGGYAACGFDHCNVALSIRCGGLPVLSRHPTLEAAQAAAQSHADAAHWNNTKIGGSLT